VPAANWEIYRVGARLGAIDGLLDSAQGEIAARLQTALSSVAVVREAVDRSSSPTDDARFIGRLLLGLLCRGWPTLASPLVEQALLDTIDPACGLAVDPAGSAGVVGWRLRAVDPRDGPAWAQTLLDGLLRGDPRLEMASGVIADLTDSDAEEAFFANELTPRLGQAIGWVELQRPMTTMARDDVPDATRIGSGRVDFALELPAQEDEHPIRLVIEFDGPHHQHLAQRTIDRHRDELLRRHGWQIQRVRTGNESADLAALETWIEGNVAANPVPFQHIDSSGDPANDPPLREATRLMLTPHATARVQLALSRALMEGALRLDQPVWKLAVVEREVPGAELAVRDWLATLGHLCALYGVAVGVRQIRLWVEQEHLTGFAEPRLPPGAGLTQVSVEPLSALPSGASVDLAIDVSVGCHPTRRYPTAPLRARGVVPRQTTILRTAQRQSGYRVESWPEPRPIAEPLAREASLVHFLHLLFRKAAFREGQLAIIERALRRQVAIGLLPTGAGKSITYQLPALLSPGLTLVIDPIKSLMQDQVENLHAAGIRDAIQINSDTPTTERARREWQFSQGEFRLVFISPERLQIQSFRDLLQETIGGRPVAYLTIDEAHCVSEWGHDFRTAYLNLGRIAARYCTRDGRRPPILALTGTASETVLRDVQRELAIDADEAIIRPAAFDREELHFEILAAGQDKKLDTLAQLLANDIPTSLGVDPDMLASGACGGIVFCPHVNGPRGVFDVRLGILGRCSQFQYKELGASLQPGSVEDLELQQVGVYAGGKPKKLALPANSAINEDQAWANLKADTQRRFTANRQSLLVATSAFGMGIDKPNIRYTIHYAMPKSIEALAQEAGRAGRDRKRAICAIIFTDDRTNGHGGRRVVRPDCLEPGIATEEAARRIDAVGRNSDDAEMQMYLHTRNYHGVRLESLAVRWFFHHWIAPALTAGDDQAQTATVVVPAAIAFPADVVQSFADSVTHGAPDGNATTAPPPEPPKPDLQRVIYRLSLLGLVEDYTIVYSQFGSDVYTLQLRPLSEQAIRDRLRTYVDRYKPDNFETLLAERIERSDLDGGFVGKAIDALIWFVYEEIEQRRRANMHGVRQILRDSLTAKEPGQELRRQLREIFSYSALTQSVFDLVRDSPRNDASWWRLADEMTTTEVADRIRLQCLRAIGESPDNPGLLLVYGLGSLASGRDTLDMNDAATRIDLGLRQAQAFRPVAGARIAARLVAEAYDKAPARADAAMRRVMQRGNVAVAQATYRRTTDVGLKRACAAAMLRSLNGALDAFFGGTDDTDDTRLAGSRTGSAPLDRPSRQPGDGQQRPRRGGNAGRKRRSGARLGA
jgi:RAD3-like DEAD/DEAH box helicase/helicase-like protein